MAFFFHDKRSTSEATKKLNGANQGALKFIPQNIGRLYRVSNSLSCYQQTLLHEISVINGQFGLTLACLMKKETKPLSKNVYGPPNVTVSVIDFEQKTFSPLCKDKNDKTLPVL